VCAGPSDNSRCLPPAEAGDECGPITLESQDDGGEVLVCVPEVCDYLFTDSGD